MLLLIYQTLHPLFFQMSALNSIVRIDFHDEDSSREVDLTSRSAASTLSSDGSRLPMSSVAQRLCRPEPGLVGVSAPARVLLCGAAVFSINPPRRQPPPTDDGVSSPPSPQSARHSKTSVARHSTHERIFVEKGLQPERGPLTFAFAQLARPCPHPFVNAQVTLNRPHQRRVAALLTARDDGCAKLVHLPNRSIHSDNRSTPVTPLAVLTVITSLR
jgi:hypothetical protein